MEEIISELIADDETDKLEYPVELSQERAQNSDVSHDEKIHMDFWSCFNKLKEVEDDGDDPGTASSVR